jgi:uncharacterized membrane protein YhfC
VIFMTVTLLNYMLGIGVLAVGIGAMLSWFLLKGKKLTYFAYFGLGAIFWAIAIAPKYIMDYTITSAFANILVSYFPMVAVGIVLALYYGLRTGLFESGFTYLIIKYTGLSRMGFNEAVALGIGFGGFEAIFFGVQWLLSTGPLTISPLDPMSYVGVWERIFTLFCHVFATVLVVYAVKLNDLRWLWLSVAYKTVLDGGLILFVYFLGTVMTSTSLTYVIESFVAILGIIGVIGVYWIAKKHGGYMPEAPSNIIANPTLGTAR